MKNIFSILIIIFMSSSFFSCDDDELAIDIPECLQTIIDEHVMNDFPQTTPRANITKHIYNGNEVFGLSFQNFPDGQWVVITLECEPICAFGGFAGVTDPPGCPNFSENTTYIGIVWTDPR